MKRRTPAELYVRHIPAFRFRPAGVITVSVAVYVVPPPESIQKKCMCISITFWHSYAASVFRCSSHRLQFHIYSSAPNPALVRTALAGRRTALR